MSSEQQRILPFEGQEGVDGEIPKVLIEAFGEDADDDVVAFRNLPVGERDQMQALLGDLLHAKAEELLRVAEQNGMTTIAAERIDWLQNHRDVGRESGENREGREWEFGNAHHREFVEKHRRRDFLNVAKQMILRHCSAQQALNLIREESLRNIEYIRSALSRKAK